MMIEWHEAEVILDIWNGIVEKFGIDIEEEVSNAFIPSRVSYYVTSFELAIQTVWK